MSESDLYEQLGRLAGALEAVRDLLSEQGKRLASMPCERHAALLQSIDERGTKALQAVSERVCALERDSEITPPPPLAFQRQRRPSEEAATRRDVETAIEDSKPIILGAAESAILQRLQSLEDARAKARAELEADAAKHREETRATVKWAVEIARQLAPAIVAALVALGVTCEMRAHPSARPSVHQQQRDAAVQPAAMRR